MKNNKLLVLEDDRDGEILVIKIINNDLQVGDHVQMHYKLLIMQHQNLIIIWVLLELSIEVLKVLVDI